MIDIMFRCLCILLSGAEAVCMEVFLVPHSRIGPYASGRIYTDGLTFS
jgi:hypothetical protein